ncbi:MAG: hypothetical protein K5668_11570 [Lachnospiraceae bacterium]|nr:hypothetical protein [Lachnospiraceae bacterium]
MGKEGFHEWEISHDLLNNKCINGFQYWNYMRRDMFMSFRDEITDVEPAFYQNMKEQDKGSIAGKLKKAMLLLLPDHGSGINRSDIMFLCHPRRQEIDGKMVSIYTDLISDDFPDSVTVQRSGLGKYEREKIYSRNLIFLDKLATSSYIYRYLIKCFRSGEYREIQKQVMRDMEIPFRDLADTYDLHPDPKAFADRVTILYYLYKYRKPRLNKLLKRISPKVIVEVVGLSFDAKIINELAYELGIETIELQHGAGGISFYYPENVQIKQFAKWYFAFGDFWKDGMKPPIPRDHILSAGFPYHDLQMKDYPAVKENNVSDAVIFLSSRKYGRELSEVASELKKIRPDLRVIFKLHPREYADYKDSYTSLKGTGVEIIADNKVPLYDLFFACSMQVGVDSTAIYEGMGFGLTTYIWNIPRAASMRAIVDSGYARLFSNASELSELMGRKNEAPEYDADIFWRKDSLDRIEREIARIGGLDISFS